MDVDQAIVVAVNTIGVGPTREVCDLVATVVDRVGRVPVVFVDPGRRERIAARASHQYHGDPQYDD